MSPPLSSNAGTPGDIFASTHWSAVIAAGRGTGPEAQAALEELCRTYWYPLYAYIRHRGHGREDAEDLVQEFFRRFLARDDLQTVDSERGRFRAFLLAAVKNFLANEWDRSRRLKRGGGVPNLSLDWAKADAQFQLASPAASPELAFDREWAMALLACVLDRLRAEAAAEGRGEHFEVLKEFLPAGRGKVSCAAAARALGQEETAVRVAVHRLRKRYRQVLRAEIAGTLADPRQVQEELNALFAAFAR